MISHQKTAESEPWARQTPHAAHGFGFATLSGRVVDGYVKDGTVFYDANGNGVRDPGEASAVTDDEGNYTLADVLRTSVGRIVVEAGGIDIETGNAVGLLMAPDTGGTTVVSPLTLLMTLNPWLNVSDLKAVLGIPEAVDLLHYDPIAAMAAGGAGASVAEDVFSAQQQVYAVIQAAAQAEAKGEKVDFASLQVAVVAVGAAVSNGAATLAEVSQVALTGIVADPVAAARIVTAVNDSVAAIATAYATSDGGLALSDARALVAAEDPAAPRFDEAVAKLAGAKAAASVSQDGLLTVVSSVATGGSYTAGDLQPLIDHAFQGYQEQVAAAAHPAIASAAASLAMTSVTPVTPLESVSSHYQFTDQQISDLLPQGDAAFDAALIDLQGRGMEVLNLTPDQITALAGADFTLDSGVDVSVTGTSFLHAGGVSPTAIGALLSPADVTVHLTGEGLGQVIAAGDPAFDDLVSQLQKAGMDRLELSNGQVGALADAGFTLNAGTEVTLTGAGFLHAGSAGAAAIGALLSPADVTVSLGNRDMGSILAGGDPAFDDLVSQLHQSGMDHLSLTSNQVDALASAGFTLNAGVDVTVTGTGFLHAAGVSPSAIGALLSPADVTVRLTDQDVGHLLQGGDAMLDALVLQLQSSGMDHLELTSSQAIALGHDNFTFDAGTSVSVTGTGFLHASGTTAGGLGSLLSAADTTVHLNSQDFGHVLSAGDAAMDTLVHELQTAGMDHLALDTSQIIQLANAHFSFDAGTDITVDGTGFLHAGGATTHDLDTLLGAAHVTVNLTAQDLGHVLAATHDAAAITAVADHLHDAGADTLGLSSYQAIELAHALSGVALTDLPLAVNIGDPLALSTASDADLTSLNTLLGASDTTADLTMGELRQANFDSVTDLQQAMDGMQHALTEGGIDHIDLSDELAHALAQANIAFLPSAAEGGTGQDIVVDASSDNDAGTAYLEVSLQQMQSLGVDEVTVANGVQKVEVAFGNEQGAAYTLDDLPHFQVAAGTEVDLVVTEDDLAKLLQQGGSFDQLAELGITDLHYTGDTSSAAYQAAAAASALPIAPVTLTPVEVQLLGLGDQPTDPMDPFHKPA